VLAAGASRLVNLVATVPATAPYGSTELLHLGVSSINANPPLVGSIAIDDALHVVGYFGDATGNALYGQDDVTLLQRVIVKTDPGFAFWSNIDPVIVGDIAGGGSLNSLDASRLLQEVNFVNGTGTIDRPEVPPIPTGIGPIVFASSQGVAPASLAAPAATTTAAKASGPVITLGKPTAAAAPALPAFAAEDAAKPWLADYLGNAGQAAKVSPNLSLKVTLDKTASVSNLQRG